MSLIRRIGIAIGSFVAAALVVRLLGGVLLVWLIGTPAPNPADRLVWLVLSAALGALIYRDIVRRDQARATRPSPNESQGSGPTSS